MIWFGWAMLLAVILIAIFWYDSGGWRYCPGCRTFWHRRDGRRSLYMPREVDQVCPSKPCPQCLKKYS